MMQIQTINRSLTSVHARKLMNFVENESIKLEQFQTIFTNLQTK